MQSLPLRTTGQDFLHSCRHSISIHQSLNLGAVVRQGRIAEAVCKLAKVTREEILSTSSVNISKTMKERLGNMTFNVRGLSCEMNSATALSPEPPCPTPNHTLASQYFRQLHYHLVNICLQQHQVHDFRFPQHLRSIPHSMHPNLDCDRIFMIGISTRQKQLKCQRPLLHSCSRR